MGDTKTQMTKVEDASDKGIFASLVEREAVRYQRKGTGLYAAFLIAFGYLWLFPVISPPLWSWCLRNFSKESLLMFGVPLFTKFFLAVTIFTFYVIYHIEHPFFEQYKANPKPWPWNEDRKKWKNLLRKTVLQSLWNNLFIIPALILPTYFQITAGNIDDLWRTDMESLPGSLEFLWQVIFCMLIEDTGFYCSHRFMHTKLCYKRFHKLHHEYYTTISIAVEHVHVVEAILGNTIPPALGPLILGNRMHLVSVIAWIVIRVAEGYDGHCGYDFPWSPFRIMPLSGGEEYHDFHHSHNVGNFSTFFTHWDTIFGTNVQFYRFLDKKHAKENKSD